MGTYIDEKGNLHSSICPGTYDILDSIVDWVRIIDNHGVIIFANKSMKKHLNMDPEGYNIESGELKDLPRTVNESHMPYTGVVKEEQKIKDRYYSIQSSPIMDEFGVIKGRIEVFRDITKENRIKVNLINANKKNYQNISFAKLIQSQILPVTSVETGLRIDYRYIPSGELSGDFFDVIRVDDDLTFFYICDVVGHGVGASMLTMFVQQSMRTIINEKKIYKPGEVLKALNKRFEKLKLGEEKYITMFCGVYKRSTSRIYYCNAGHMALPLKITKEGCQEIKGRGLPISPIFTENCHEEKSCEFKKDDLILLYTDGITETRNFSGDFYGGGRICGVVSENKEAILDSIIKDVSSFRWGEQEDDIALLLLQPV